jgi:hypothetical protein
VKKILPSGKIVFVVDVSIFLKDHIEHGPQLMAHHSTTDLGSKLPFPSTLPELSKHIRISSSGPP